MAAGMSPSKKPVSPGPQIGGLEVPDIGDHRQLSMLEGMITIRRVEEELSKLYFEGKVPGSLDLCVGEEAVAVGACAALDGSSDVITSTHRGHGHVIAKGADLNRFIAELLGRSTGFCKGKGGSMHVADVETGVYGTGIVGGGIPLAAGFAFANQVLGKPSVALAFFGDGAAQQGQFHETLNLASLWRLPVIFLCQNNGFATTTRPEQASASRTIAERAAAYAMPGEVVDGNDVVAVYRAVANARRRAVEGHGPALIEARTYRVSPQVEGEDKVFATRRPYRAVAEVDLWKAPDHDPIARYSEHLLKVGLLDERKAQDIKQRVDATVASAIEFGLASPFPEAAEAAADVFGTAVTANA
jgi:acetoin:2,6-dichlorophenolindophenol oxidoreductase subunit alpha